LLILIFLGLLAAFDLFVGVSNDAVNFLNSAVGSRISSYRIIMLVASVGVLIGATFSSGMMEVARSGVFNPQMFSFSEIMVIFFAVMITDVLLLDIFNSLGLPTSTTVSIVFELLGGAVAVASFKILQTDHSWINNIGDYINNEKGLAIISGILISVIVAFVAGTIIQFAARLIFSFKFEKTYRWFGSSFGGLSITAILYFLVMKGAQGASFMRPEYIHWMDQNTLPIIATCFVGLTIIFQFLITLFNFNVFKIIILSGTFALAFAFAGNDLVNFIGVPLAALDSYNTYQSSGIAADTLTMTSLHQAVKTPTSYLLLAGLIMVLTLWFSKKAQKVVQTSINLSSSNRGAKEQFGSSMAGRKIVRNTLKLNRILAQIIPNGMQTFISSRLEQVPRKKGEIQLPFDQVRASINLIVSSVLIASATSLKLPLSTTYVTFMVAMGSSFADGAWDRESAVYRISGVMTVIGGWFVTAFTAFSICLLVAISVMYSDNAGIIGWMAVVIFVLVKSNFIPSKKKQQDSISPMERLDKNFICKHMNDAVIQYHNRCTQLYKIGITAFLNEDLKTLRKCKNDAIALFEESSKKRGEYYRFAVEGSEDKIDRDAHYYYYRVFSNLKEITHNMKSTFGGAYNHLDNNHRVYKGVLRNNLEKVVLEIEQLQTLTANYLSGITTDEHLYSNQTNDIIQLINDIQKQMMGRIEEDDLSLRGSEMYLNLLQLAREMTNRFSLMALLQHELADKCCTISKSDL
jgi:phosphate/sulfate permease